MMERTKRADIPVKETWDLSDLFETEVTFEGELNSLEDDVQTVLDYKSKLGNDADTLLGAIKTMEAFMQRIIKVGSYAMLKISADGSDSANQSLYAKTITTLTNVETKLAFFDPELLAIPEDTLKKFIDELPGLQIYKKMLYDILDKRAFTFTAEIEEILGALGEVHGAPQMIYERSKSADFDFASVEDNEGNTLPMSESLYEDKYEMSANTTIRRKTYESFIQTLSRYKNTFAATYQTEVTKQITMAKLRGYSSVTDMLLQDQHVTKEMYENQLNIIQEELAPHMRKYANLLKADYGLETLHFSDLKAPLDPDYNPEITFEEAKKMIQDALSIMGDEYKEIITKGLNERWVDYADNIGKQSGAFCASPYGSHPYILMTWTNQMRGAFTLAHELGHAGHFYLANHYQKLMNTDVSTYFVEAPSTLNELLLAEHLLQNTTDKRKKRWIISELLGTYYHNFITHLLEAEFQHRIYQLAENGVPLTADVLCEQKTEAIANFWGDTVKLDEGTGLTWMRQQHYYMGLYPYTYSAGLTVSTAVLQRIKSDPDVAISDWLDVLKAGGSLTPLELTKKAGVDMLDPETIKSAVSYVGDLIDQLEESYQ